MNKLIIFIGLAFLLASVQATAPTLVNNSSSYLSDQAYIVVAHGDYFISVGENVLRYDLKTNKETLIVPQGNCPAGSYFLYSSNFTYFCSVNPNNNEADLRQIDIKNMSIIQSTLLPQGYVSYGLINRDYLLITGNQGASLFSLLTSQVVYSSPYGYTYLQYYVTATATHLITVIPNNFQSENVSIQYYNYKSNSWINKTFNYEMEMSLGGSFLNETLDVVMIVGSQWTDLMVFLYQNGVVIDELDFTSDYNQMSSVKFIPINDTTFLLAVPTQNEENFEVMQISVSKSNFEITNSIYLPLINTFVPSFFPNIYTFSNEFIAINFNLTSFAIQSVQSLQYPPLTYKNGSVIIVYPTGYFVTLQDGTTTFYQVLMTAGLYFAQSQPEFIYGFNPGCGNTSQSCNLMTFNAYTNTISQSEFKNCPCSKTFQQYSLVSVTQYESGAPLVTYYNQYTNSIFYSNGKVGSEMQIESIPNIFGFFVNASNMELSIVYNNYSLLQSNINIETYSLTTANLINTVTIMSFTSVPQFTKLDERTFVLGVTKVGSGNIYLYDVVLRTNIVTNLGQGFTNLVPLGVIQYSGSQLTSVAGYAYLGNNAETCVVNQIRQTSCVGSLLAAPQYQGENSFVITTTTSILKKQMVYTVTNWGNSKSEKMNLRMESS